MNTKEMEDLVLLFKQYWNCSATNNRGKMNAYYLALQPYEYKDVGRAVIEYARDNKFFPDIYDITSRLPRVEEPPLVTALRNLNGVDFMVACHQLYRERMRAAKLPTVAEAQAAGIPFSEWLKDVEETRDPDMIESILREADQRKISQ